MEPVLNFLQRLDLHPIADHYTVALLTIAVLVDLLASLVPTRLWIRYAALLLTVLGAAAAWASYATGDLETERIWKALGPPAQEILKRHAILGFYLAIAFGVLALWRILIQAIGFFDSTRAIYLIIAVLAVVTLTYQGYLGGKLVYDYGAGTALMASQPIPTPQISPPGTPTPASALPTVSVPTSVATVAPTATPSAPAAAPATPSPSPTPAPAESPPPTHT